MSASPPSTGAALSRAWWVDRLRSAAIVLPASFLLGALTSIGQLALPPAVNSLANSAGGWSAIAFALVWTARCRPWWGIALAVASFLLLNAGYAVMSATRGFTWSMGLDNFFVLMGFVAGPFVGLAAVWMRSRSIRLVAVASALLPAILIGEGIYGLTIISATTSPVYWSLSIAFGILFLAAASWLRIRAVGPILLSVTLTLTGAAVFLIGYSAI